MTLPGLVQLEERLTAASHANDPTAALLADHQWLRSLLDHYARLVDQEENLAEILAAIQELSPFLDLHIRREEEAYFPAVEGLMQESGQGSTFDMYGEHDAIRIRLDELLTSLARRSDAVHAFAAFSRSLSIHFETEEELVFAVAVTDLSEDARREILVKFSVLAASM